MRYGFYQVRYESSIIFLEEIISEMPGMEHDYYEIWERILKKLVEEFVNILKETSFSQS